MVAHQLLLEMFRDAPVIYDEGGSDAAVFAVLFVVVDLDDSDAAPIRKRDRLTVADRVAFVSDDPDFSTGQIDEAETWHGRLIIAKRKAAKVERWREARETGPTPSGRSYWNQLF